jgi:GR25 family glycosyltransferase involved in LPS biosynthesis
MKTINNNNTYYYYLNKFFLFLNMNLSISDKYKYGKTPTVCLNMIVKNESKVIAETLNNLTGKIKFDYWVISDTGSTDNTREIIKDYFLEKGIPGELFIHEWKDFGYNRSKALESAYDKTDFLLIFDADDKIVGDFKLPFKNGANSDRYMLKFGQGFEYMRPLLINNRKRWRFRGVLHEFLDNLEPVNEDINVMGNYYIESGRTGNRSQNPTKYYDDANILKNAYAIEMTLPDKGLSGRYAFYCARSYHDAGEKYHNEAIEWYKTVLGIKHHWNQEQYYSALEIGIIYKAQKNMEEACKYLLKTMEYDHERIEGLIMAMEHYYQSGQHVLVNALYHKYKKYSKNLIGKLFINQYFYKDRLEFFNSMSAYKINDVQSGYECFKHILLNQSVGEHELNVMINNVGVYSDMLQKDRDALTLFKIVDDMLHKHNNLVDNPNVVTLFNLLFNKNRENFTVYNKPIVKILRKNMDLNYTINRDKRKILITFTTCKRYDLFKETVNSLLNQWTDVEKITHWFCVDDNSSNEDRQQMKSVYSWIEYYMKTPEEKGHRASMNIIWKKIADMKPEYWIHMEDDFLFYYPMDYVTQAIAALKEFKAQNIRQIVFNRNYSETFEHYSTKGHLATKNPNIVLHEYIKNSQAQYRNAHYWSHYSFRPSMTDVKTIIELGNYNSPNQFFERDYADRWSKANYKTAFFNRITHRHTGRLTSEINDTNGVKNAYQLNSEEQFNQQKKHNIQIVNLERRPDRKKTTEDLFEKHNIENYQFVNAVDGNVLEPTRELQLLFKDNDFNSRRGVIGCAMSHLKLWRELLDDKHNPYYVIFEDDIELCAGFRERFEKLKPELEKQELLFIGYHMFNDKRKEVVNIYDTIDTDVNTVTKIMPLDRNLYIGGTFAYTVNKIGAKKLVDYIEKNGIKHGIDYLMKIVPDIQHTELQPLLVNSEWCEKQNDNVDTDIQKDFNKLDFSTIIEDQFIFFPKLDQNGNDLYFQREGSVTDKMLKALKDKNCVGFNTLGFFKNKIEKLTQSEYFKEQDGLYVKRGVTDAVAAPEVKNVPAAVVVPDVIPDVMPDVMPNVMPNAVADPSGQRTIKVKMLCNWRSSQELCKELSNMCLNGFIWKNIEMVWSDTATAVDYYVIINYPLPNEYYDPKRTIIYQMEPWIYDQTKNWGVKTWGEWANPDPTKFLKVFTHKNHLNNVQWLIKYPFYTKPIITNAYRKDKVSVVCSEKYHDTGHILRNTMIRMNHNLNIESWGRENYHKFNNHRGKITNDNKFNVYANYKYILSVENNSEMNYATEKLWEGILCEALCFYWGCPNIDDYIDPRAFVKLPLEDPVASLKIIQQAIDEDWWSQRIEVIKQMKDKILNQIGFFPQLSEFLTSSMSDG